MLSFSRVCLQISPPLQTRRSQSAILHHHGIQIRQFQGCKLLGVVIFFEGVDCSRKMTAFRLLKSQFIPVKLQICLQLPLRAPNPTCGLHREAFEAPPSGQRFKSYFFSPPNKHCNRTECISKHGRRLPTRVLRLRTRLFVFLPRIA